MAESDQVPATGAARTTPKGDSGTIKLGNVDRWLKISKELGFPMVIAAVLLWSHFTVMQRLITALEKNNVTADRVERVLWKVERSLGLEAERTR